MLTILIMEGDDICLPFGRTSLPHSFPIGVIVDLWYDGAGILTAGAVGIHRHCLYLYQLVR